MITKPYGSYEGNEPYIFISYAHKDESKVYPVIRGLQERGFRIWYDAGIEPGTEWPEYIAEHINNSGCVLCFVSENALNSQNCRREIAYAIDEHKNMMAAYLEKVSLSAGMKMQLGILQAIFRDRHNSDEAFIEALSKATLLGPCKNGNETENSPSQNAVTEEAQPAVNAEVASQHEETENALPHKEAKKKKGMAKFLAIFPYTGLFGVHDFYLGKKSIGFLKLFTMNFFAIGWIIDIITILSGKYKTKNGEYLK